MVVRMRQFIGNDVRTLLQCGFEGVEKGMSRDQIDDDLEHDQHDEQETNRLSRQAQGDTAQALVVAKMGAPEPPGKAPPHASACHYALILYPTPRTV
jgi:hypothetical protein